MQRLAACLLLLTATPSAATTAAGTWFGIGQYRDKGGMYIDRMLPDGRIYSFFRSCTKGKAEDHSQEGRWSVENGMLIIRVGTYDGQASPRTDFYKVRSVGARNFDYDLLPVNFPFHAKRVAPDFKMPSCDMVS